jgi:hypothetical protein
MALLSGLNKIVGDSIKKYLKLRKYSTNSHGNSKKI